MWTVLRSLESPKYKNDQQLEHSYHLHRIHQVGILSERNRFVCNVHLCKQMDACILQYMEFLPLFYTLRDDNPDHVDIFPGMDSSRRRYWRIQYHHDTYHLGTFYRRHSNIDPLHNRFPVHSKLMCTGYSDNIVRDDKFHVADSYIMALEVWKHRFNFVMNLISYLSWHLFCWHNIFGPQSAWPIQKVSRTFSHFPSRHIDPSSHETPWHLFKMHCPLTHFPCFPQSETMLRAEPSATNTCRLHFTEVIG